uniref:BRCT domain-containing protein n=1 Tax=Heterorhabditis bacteriophora TaxID=37862 RepID=A0A1I7WPG3_HETBA
MLFLDDARMKNFTSAYKDIDFLTFFYKNLRFNDTNRYKELFPFLSLCGRERNYLRCDDRPIVFTEIQQNTFRIGGSKITVPLKPDSLSMLSNGRLYHPSPFGEYGLVKSSLADQLFPLFKFDSNGYPTSVYWDSQWTGMSAPNAPKKPRRNSIDNVTPVCTQKCGNHDLDGSMDDVQDIIFYVKLDVDNDLTAEEADLHVKTFQMLEDSKANPVWLPEDECMRISRNDPNFFFLPVFRGKVFDHLKSLNVKVYSSFLVRQLLYNGGCLPKWTHPVYSLSMSGSVICFTGLPSARRAELTDLIHYMNGVVSKALHEKVTHLVTEKCDSTSNKYTEARRLRLPVMSPVWIEDGWKHATEFIKDDITSIEKRKPYVLPIFSQMLLTSSGVVSTERSELIRLIEVNGGKFQGDMKRDSCTHLITDKTTGDKYRKVFFGTGGRLNTSTVNTQLNRIENAENTLSRTPLTALRYNTLKRDPNKRRMEPPPNCVDPTDILEETYLRGDFDFLEVWRRNYIKYKFKYDYVFII